MSGFPILDLILGLVFIFFVLSIISSAVVESILTKRRYRSKVLTRWLFTIFDKKVMQPDGKIVRLGQAIADHCLTTALARVGESTAFIDAKNFVSALIEKISFNPEHPDTDVIRDLDELILCIQNGKALDGTSMLSTELKRTVLLFANEAKLLAPSSIVNAVPPTNATELPNSLPRTDAKTSLQIFREKMEHWFDSNMDRISGELKKKYARPLTFWVGLVVVVLLNADTIQIAGYLYANKEEAKLFADRATVAAQAIQKRSGEADTTGATVQIKAAIDSLRSTVPKGMPLGWSDAEQKDYVGSAKRHAIGWLATVMAIMLGAPFWFDLLNKIANIRGSGSKPSSTTDQQRNQASSKP